MKLPLLSVPVWFAILTFAEIDVKPSGLRVEIVEKPSECDKTAERGLILSMHYTGTLLSG